MLMTFSLLFFGSLSIVLSFIWYRRAASYRHLFEMFRDQLGFEDIDVSGKREFTNCISHQWVMKNVVFGEYSKSGEKFRDYLMNNTLSGALLVGIILGSAPMLIGVIFFQSVTIAGAASIVFFATVFIIRSPGNVDSSVKLLNWLSEQEEDKLRNGDLAYAKISRQSLQSWTRNLVLIGILAIAISPWGELMPDAAAYGLASWFGLLLDSIYLPLAPVAFPIAFILFILAASAPFIITLGIMQVVRSRRTAEEDGAGSHHQW